MVSNIFYVHPYLVKMIQFDPYFSKGLVQPPTRKPQDHFETSEEALQDITFLLRRAAVQRQLRPEELKVGENRRGFFTVFGRGFSGETRGA